VNPVLYIVSTPIGNPDDITLRALRVLREANAIICEEPREGARLLRYYKIHNELVALNEHTERAVVPDLLARLQRGETLALISDHGTPLLADPGGHLVQRALAENIPVRAVPGASSLLAALVVSGLPLERFRLVGFLPAQKAARRRAGALARRTRHVGAVRCAVSLERGADRFACRARTNAPHRRRVQPDVAGRKHRARHARTSHQSLSAQSIQRRIRHHHRRQSYRLNFGGTIEIHHLVGRARHTPAPAHLQ